MNIDLKFEAQLEWEKIPKKSQMAIRLLCNELRELRKFKESIKTLVYKNLKGDLNANNRR